MPSKADMMHIVHQKTILFQYMKY